jgi:enoyl-CoA hydratase/carnithine racemase
MASPTVRVSRQGPVAIITLDNPTTHNSLDGALRTAFADACATVADSDARVVVFEGASAVFASGALPPGANGAGAAVAALRMPTIAWIDGACVDMGLELALACDVRVASAQATFAMRQAHGGGLPWDGGTQRLARLVGRGQALRLLLTGDTIDAVEAERIGLVERVGERDAAIEIASAMAAGGPIAASYTAEAVREGLDLTLEQGLRLEADLSVLLQSTDDRAAGLRSFVDRAAPPTYEGK